MASPEITPAQARLREAIQTAAWWDRGVNHRWESDTDVIMANDLLVEIVKVMARAPAYVRKDFIRWLDT